MHRPYPKHDMYRQTIILKTRNWTTIIIYRSKKKKIREAAAAAANFNLQSSQVPRLYSSVFSLSSSKKISLCCYLFFFSNRETGDRFSLSGDRKLWGGRKENASPPFLMQVAMPCIGEDGTHSCTQDDKCIILPGFPAYHSQSKET